MFCIHLVGVPSIRIDTNVNVKPVSSSVCGDIVQEDISLAIILGENKAIKFYLEKDCH